MAMLLGPGERATCRIRVRSGNVGAQHGFGNSPHKVLDRVRCTSTQNSSLMHVVDDEAPPAFDLSVGNGTEDAKQLLRSSRRTNGGRSAFRLV